MAGEERVEQVQHRIYAVKDPIPFPELRRLLAENKTAQDAVEFVENARSRSVSKTRPLTHEEIAGSASAALLLGKNKLFMERYREYVRTFGGTWHPDLEHKMFWDRVLGPGWGGSDAVPEGAARDEIVLMTANAFAFFASPPESARGRGLCGAPYGEEWLEVAAALRVLDVAALDERLVADSQAAHAARELMRGIYDHAQEDFESLFGRSEDKRYAFVSQSFLPLLIYAMLGGILGGASPRFLKTWFQHARYALEQVFPPSMAREGRQLSLFLDHLELVDALVNRYGSADRSLQFDGALSYLPFAMSYTSLPAWVQQKLEPDVLASAVETSAQAGLSLLARYGAIGLLRSDALTSEWRRQFETMLKEGEVDVKLPPAPPPVTQRALAELWGIMQKSTRRGSSLQRGRGAQPPTLVASRTQTGVIIELGDEEYLSEWVHSAALKCIRKYAHDGRLYLEGAEPAEFTRLFFALGEQVDIIGNLTSEEEDVLAAAPKPVLLLTRECDGSFLAALRLRLMPGTSLLAVPACGLGGAVLEDTEGRAISVRRHIASELALVEQTAEAMRQAGGAGTERLVHGEMVVPNVKELADLLRICRVLGLETCWEAGYALLLHQPQKGLTLRLTGEGREWLELGGELPVDEGRVLELAALLEKFAAREGDILRLGAGEYVLLTPPLERQLTLLELIRQEKQGKLCVAASALPLLEVWDASSAADDTPVAPEPVPYGLQTTLRPYQEEGFRWLAERAQMGLGALLADDMGLGKTVQVLALLLHSAGRNGAGASLVVVPVSLLGNWAEEAARFAPSLKLITYDPKKPDILKGLGAGTLVLASYGQIASRVEDFAAVGWEALVLDEAQTIKNPDSQRARAVCTLNARARFCLTGTPIENSLLDLWSQMRFLNPGLFGARKSFLQRFKKAQPETLSRLRQALASLVLRRTKAEVLTQLPPLTETVEWIEFSREERALYESLRRSAAEKLGRESHADSIGILAELTRLRRACCHGKLVLADFAGNSAKLAVMKDRVEELRAADRRVLIFSQFTDVLDLAQESLQTAGLSFLRLDGSTPAAQRRKLVNAFQEGRADTFLISLKAGGAGLNLTAADYVMLLDPWWNPAVEAQAAGRSHRMGQQNPVTLCRFLVRGTVEERILELHRDKKELAESILSGAVEGVNMKALRDLLTEG